MNRTPPAVEGWPDQPLLLEINCWVWLRKLSRRYGREITLGIVPENEWDTLLCPGVDGVWLMGVWRRSAAARIVSVNDAGVIAECQRQISDFSTNDLAGSPYSIREYVVEPLLGGAEGLATARRQLAARGLRLLLDFVPNHVSPDHPWLNDHPEYFVGGTEIDLELSPAAFFRAGGKIVAHGRDPYFAPWRDTAQLNAFDASLREAAIGTLLAIAAQCDGVRCDMAMLLINRIFRQTWAGRMASTPGSEYWQELIGRVHQVYPGFLFVAESYWDLESELLQMGFSYCYDKRFYDRLVEGNCEGIRQHLRAPVEYQRHLIRFLENHDEPRAAAVFAPEQNRAAAVALLTVPGAKLLQDGQCLGARVKLCVHLGRGPTEFPDEELASFYSHLLKVVGTTQLRRGTWQLCQPQGWPDNDSCQSLISWCSEVDDSKYAIVINLRDQQSQGRVILPWTDLKGQNWSASDLLSGQDYGNRGGDEMCSSGLYVDLPPWGFHFLRLMPQ